MKTVQIPGPFKYFSMTAAAALLAVYSAASLGGDVMVKLSGDQEVPPVSTKASGSGTITVNPDKAVSGKVTTTGVAGTMAHIHQGAAGKNGPPIITLTKEGDSGWAVPAGSKLDDAQYKAFQAGELYVNVHSAENKGGEVRGQLKP
jgi:hypothetical protein